MLKHIAIRETTPSPSGKTKRWHVLTLDSQVLGGIGWFAPWRRYCFWPTAGTVYEQDCLRDIATFCEERTREHKSA